MNRIDLRICLSILTLLTAVFGSSAKADVTATFLRENGARWVIEVAADGSARIQRGNRGRLERGYTLVRDGKVYRVSPGAGGPVATSVEAQAYLYRQSVRRREIILSSDNKANLGKPLSWVPGEAAQIAGYAGTRYKMPGSDAPALVLSDDPRLQPLGRALAGFLSQSIANGPDSEVAALLPLLATHGVLSFAGQDLAEVTFTLIDPARFALPATVVTLADVKEEDEDEDEGDQKPQPLGRTPVIVKGVYRNGTLYLLDDFGAMQVWAVGANSGMPYAVPEPVRSFCLIGNGLWVITLDRKATVASLWLRNISQLRGAPADGQWAKVAEFPQSDVDKVLALDCSGIEPILLSTQHLVMPILGRRVDVAAQTLMPRGFVVSQVQDGALWLGFNAGEWGGGLRRVRLANGMVDAPTNVDPHNLCGGILNPACDPVTGLAPDPVRPGCMLATIGLVHMLSHGSVVRICGKEVTLVYAKPYTMDPAWHWDGKLDRDKTASVAFYSMIADPEKPAVWAVGSDGIYRFTGAPLPEFNPFPKRRHPVVDWSNPEFILISTDMNRQHSLSGSSLILVPR